MLTTRLPITLGLVCVACLMTGLSLGQEAAAPAPAEPAPAVPAAEPPAPAPAPEPPPAPAPAAPATAPEAAPAPAAPAAPAEAAPAPAAPAPPVQGRVLLVHSYHPEYEWVQDVTAGVKQIFDGTEVKLDTFHMDTKRRDFEEWKREAGKLARRHVEDFKPDVIIASDDDAQEYFAKDYAGKEGAPRIVFCGVNNPPSTYGYPAANVTGILEQPHFDESIAMLKVLCPNVERVAIIADKSTTSDGVMQFVRTRQSAVKVAAMDEPRTFDKWQSTIQKYEKTVDAIGFATYHTIREKRDGEIVFPGKVMSWTIENTTKPTFAFLSFAVQDGALFGIVESGQEQGREAAKIAVELLQGKKAADCPIKPAVEGHVMVNLKTAAKLGITIPQEILDKAQKIIRP